MKGAHMYTVKLLFASSRFFRRIFWKKLKVKSHAFDATSRVGATGQWAFDLTDGSQLIVDAFEVRQILFSPEYFVQFEAREAQARHEKELRDSVRHEVKAEIDAETAAQREMHAEQQLQALAQLQQQHAIQKHNPAGSIGPIQGPRFAQPQARQG
jgi:hypothetical protein